MGLVAGLALAHFGSNALAAPAPAPGQPRSFRELPADAYRPGKILVVPKAGRELDLGRFHQTRQNRIRRAFPALGGTQVIELPPGIDTLAALEAYQNSGLVEIAEPDILFRLALLPNDPSILDGTQWGLHNTGALGGVPGADIQAATAWDRFNSASNIVVAIIDSGARLTHQDLAANLWINPGEIAGNGRDDDGNGIIDDINGINAVSDTGQPGDELGHGTHVAGIIGAVGNNGVGTCGVAWRVQIMPLRFLNPGQLGLMSDLLQCLDYARTKGARVINCSFTTTTYSATMSNAFWNVREAGIVVAAASGNEGSDNDVLPSYPASLKIDNIVSVTATTQNDAFSGYNYGLTSVHLGAPGTGIWSTYYRSDTDYTYETGTSMAAPFVAGALALMRARFPTLTPAQTIARLLASVDPLPSLAGRCQTGGRLNLDRALGPRDYSVGSSALGWVETNGATPLNLVANGISDPLPLPFAFSFYGRTQTQVYVAANGIVGFDPAGLASPTDSLLPNATINPNGAVYPYWDSLNPGPGQIWAGSVGTTPNRKYVVSWVDVPHVVTLGGISLFTFQAVLHESGEISFQYLDVTNGRPTYAAGRSASIGIEDYSGQLGISYAYHASALTNGQAIVFSPVGSSAAAPSLESVGVSGGQLVLRLFGSPGRRYAVSAANNPLSWSPVLTNTLPASGMLETLWPIGAPARFYRARVAP